MTKTIPITPVPNPSGPCVLERGISLLALAIQFCLRDPRIDANPIAPSSLEELEANHRAALTQLP